MPYKEFCVFFSGKLFYKSNRKLFSCVCIAWYKHSRGWENSRQLCKPETQSRVCITVSNSPTHSRVYIRLCKHAKRFLLLKCKPSTSSGVCINVENSPKASSVYIRLYKRMKKVFYCFYKTTFPRKKRKTLCTALIKREILTSRKILSTKSCTRNQFLFCKKMLSKIRTFLA